MKYKFKVWMDHSFVSGMHKKNKVINYTANYLCRPAECIGIVKNGRLIVKRDKIEEYRIQTRSRWEEILAMERRYDARLQNRLIVPIPNILHKKGIEKIANDVSFLLTNRQSCRLHIDIVLHRGRKKNKLNHHLHIAYSERDLVSRKKTRHMKHRSFFKSVQKTIEKSLQEMGFEVVDTPEYLKKPHLPRNIYQMYLKDPVAIAKKYHNAKLLYIIHNLEKAEKIGNELEIIISHKKEGERYLESIGCYDFFCLNKHMIEIIDEYNFVYHSINNGSIPDYKSKISLIEKLTETGELELAGYWLEKVELDLKKLQKEIMQKMTNSRDLSKYTPRLLR